MSNQDLLRQVVNALENAKAFDIIEIDVKKLTSITDAMVICSGRSSRHIRAIAENVVKELKESGNRPLSIEGNQQSDWVLVDAADVLIHVMLPDARAHYDLESLWGEDIAQNQSVN